MTLRVFNYHWGHEAVSSISANSSQFFTIVGRISAQKSWIYMICEKEQITHMNNFFCGLHYSVGLAECSNVTVSLWEASFSDDNEVPSGSSSTQRLIRTACKEFHHRGSQQCATSTLFHSYSRVFMEEC